jgi:serine/threonine protein kinase
LRRFEQEARAAAALNHPNIVCVYDMGVVDGSSYIVSELLVGQTLRAVLNEGPVPTTKALCLATQLASGLAEAHDSGIVHRDLKPENLFVIKDDQLKILDFGLAKLTAAADPDRITDEGPFKLKLAVFSGPLGTCLRSRFEVKVLITVLTSLAWAPFSTSSFLVRGHFGANYLRT